ncbi:MAG: hypothetical protein KIG94_02115 [Acetatifactor sp.]|nr:hypothetical protein [Acetatifactor sp.]
MTKVIGVRFRTAGKVYYFDPLQYQIKRGDHVIVETARGIEYGLVMTGVTEVDDSKVIQPLKPVLRIATERDTEQEANNKIKEREAFKICQEKIRSHGLEMKLIDAEYTFDNNKVLFYFTADGRIDFRELVKDLAGVFRTRIELRQIGVRDETKLMGGIGICGRPLCCHSYLADFVPVSIKMAKEQNLSLNPTKISGVCGRLMCCLKNEEDTYEELNRRLPGIGDTVATEDGLRGEVASVNVLRQLVKVVVESGDTKEIKEYPVTQLRFRRKGGHKDKQELSKEELEELELLESEEKTEKAESKDNASASEGGHSKQGKGNRSRQEGRKNEGKNRPEAEKRSEGRLKAEHDKRNRNEADRSEGGEKKGMTEGEKRKEGRKPFRGEGRRDHKPAEGGEKRVDHNREKQEAKPEKPSLEGSQRETAGQDRPHGGRNRHRRHDNRPKGEGARTQNDSQA